MWPLRVQALPCYLPGYTVRESIPPVVDSIGEPLRWEGKPDVAEVRGRTVRIRFSLWQAEMYAFWFAG